MMHFPPNGVYRNKTATIANGQTKSAVMNMGGLNLVGIMMPAAFTGATISFEMCDTETGTFIPVYNASGLVSYTVVQGRYYAIDPKDFKGIRFVKIVSASAEGGARSLVLSLKAE